MSDLINLNTLLSWIHAPVPSEDTVEIAKSSETNFVTVPAPTSSYRPKSDLDGVERVLSVFADLPVVPGKVDVAYDPIAKMSGGTILALRVNGFVWVGTIEAYPENGSLLGEWLKTAHLNRSGYSRTTFNAADILGNLRPEVTEGLSNKGVEQILSLVADNGFRLQVQTVPEHTNRTWNVELFLQAYELGQNLLLATPVRGAMKAGPEMEMYGRLPLPFRDAVMRDVYGIPNIPRVVMTYGSGNAARIGLKQLEAMPKGFEVPVEPLQKPESPVQKAGFGWLELLAMLGLRRSQSRYLRALPAPATALSKIVEPKDVIIGDVSYPGRFIQFIRGFGNQLFVERSGPFIEGYRAPKSVEEMNPAHLRTVYNLWLKRVIRMEPQADPASHTGLFTVVTIYHTAPHGVGVMTSAGNSMSGSLIDVSNGRLMKIELADHGTRSETFLGSGKVEIWQREHGKDDIFTSISEFNRLLPILNGESHPDNLSNGSPLWYFSARELSPKEAQRVRVEVKRLGANFNMPGLEALLRGLFAKDTQEAEGLNIPEHASFLGLNL